LTGDQLIICQNSIHFKFKPLNSGIHRNPIGALILWIGLTLVLSSCILTPPAFDEDAWQETVAGQTAEKLYAPHVQNGVFFNPWMPMQKERLKAFLKWRFSKKADYTVEEKSFLPGIQTDLAQRLRRHPAQNHIAWIGHATFLIQTSGITWLTDPMLTDRALLPKRVTPPALTLADLQNLTSPLFVLISHNHYDHLDKDSIRALPGHARVFVPPGLKEWVQSYFSGAVEEVDWWERVDIEQDVCLTALPAQHWSRRIGQDVNTSLWSSYLLETPDATIYYGGDSGYFVGYREIGQRFPGIDYALIPLTAYHPRWFMHYAHMDASESILAFRDLGAKYFIPTQWGAFQLGDNPPGYPALDLRRQMKRLGLDSSRYIIMDIGQMIVIPKKSA